MQRILLTLLVVALVGCGAVEAQTRSANTPRTQRTPPPPSTMMPSPSPSAAPGTLPTVGVTGPLGTIFLYTGSLGPIPGNSLGTILVCPTIGNTSSVTAAASSPLGTTGSVMSSSSPSSAPSVAPLPITSPFGMSTIAGTCNPTTTTTDSASALSTVDSTLTSSLVSSAPPTLTPSSTVATPNFNDATTPSGATAPGLSPEIPVPAPTPAAPTLSTTPCLGISTMTETSSLAMPNNNSSVATMPGLSSPSGC